MRIQRITSKSILALILFSISLSKCNDDACKSFNTLNYKNIAAACLVGMNLLLYRYERNLLQNDKLKMIDEASDHAKQSHVPDPIYWTLSNGIKTSIKGFRYISTIGLTCIAYDIGNDYYKCKQQ